MARTARELELQELKEGKITAANFTRLITQHRAAGGVEEEA